MLLCLLQGLIEPPGTDLHLRILELRDELLPTSIICKMQRVFKIGYHRFVRAKLEVIIDHLVSVEQLLWVVEIVLFLCLFIEKLGKPGEADGDYVLGLGGIDSLFDHLDVVDYGIRRTNKGPIDVELEACLTLLARNNALSHILSNGLELSEPPFVMVDEIELVDLRVKNIVTLHLEATILLPWKMFTNILGAVSEGLFNAAQSKDGNDWLRKLA